MFRWSAGVFCEVRPPPRIVIKAKLRTLMAQLRFPLRGIFMPGKKSGLSEISSASRYTYCSIGFLLSMIKRREVNAVFLDVWSFSAFRLF